MSTRDLARIGIPILIGVIALIIVIVAVYFPPAGNLVCNLSSAPGDPHADYTYTINFSLWKVKEIETKEVITSKNKEILLKFEEIEKEYSKEYELVDYYQRKITVDDKKLTSTTTVQYNKIKSNSKETNEATIKRKNLRIGYFKRLCQELGATCKYK